MGGSGSGRGWHSTRTEVEACRTIDAARWQSEGFFRPGFRVGPVSWVWSDPETREERASISFETDCDETTGSVRLRYSMIRGGERIPYDYRVDLTTTRTSWDRLRWWFACPLSSNGNACGRRVRILYLPFGAGYYGCRHCFNLTYRSCNEKRPRFDPWTGMTLAELKRLLKDHGISAKEWRRRNERF